MAKKNDPREVQSTPVASHGLLHGLIEYLHHLIIVISSRLRHTQIHHSPMGDAKGEFDIWERLGGHVEQIPVEESSHEKSSVIRNGKAASPRRQKNVRTPAPLASAAERDPNGLGEYNKQKAILRRQPRLHKQLQRKTTEHINIALILAKEGDKDGAKLHIELANGAMHTASRFMSHDEYEVFEKKIERRIESIIRAEGDAQDVSES